MRDVLIVETRRILCGDEQMKNILYVLSETKPALEMAQCEAVICSLFIRRCAVCAFRAFRLRPAQACIRIYIISLINCGSTKRSLIRSRYRR